MLNSPADGTVISLILGCKSLVQPLVEDLFTNHANGSEGPPALVPSAGMFNIFGNGPSFFPQKSENFVIYWKRHRDREFFRAVLVKILYYFYRIYFLFIKMIFNYDRFTTNKYNVNLHCLIHTKINFENRKNRKSFFPIFSINAFLLKN